ncbi:MAG: hypothetical protein M3R04_00605, partial [bacterium]|nr:hypothetical protein [bacterium]
MQRLLPSIVLLLLTVLSVSALLFFAISRWGNPNKRGLLPKAMIQGSPLKWRQLAVRPFVSLGPVRLGSPEGTFGALIIGNFDDDPDQEILRVPGSGARQTSTELEESELYDLDGTKRGVLIPQTGFELEGYAWDWDRDGIDEVLPEPDMYSFDKTYAKGIEVNTPEWDAAQESEVPVFKIDGELATMLPMYPQPFLGLTLDLDGDGWSELLLRRGGSPGYTAFGEKGKVVWEVDTDKWVIFPCKGDFDGDSREEVTYIDKQK